MLCVVTMVSVQNSKNAHSSPWKGLIHNYVAIYTHAYHCKWYCVVDLALLRER